MKSFVLGLTRGNKTQSLQFDHTLDSFGSIDSSVTITEMIRLCGFARLSKLTLFAFPLRHVCTLSQDLDDLSREISEFPYLLIANNDDQQCLLIRTIHYLS